ncbi:MAG: hypothetical protein ACJ8J0_28025 [Longimicrobiaceae bacterium]
MDEQALQRVLAVKRRVEDELLRIPGVHGVSVGPRQGVGGEPGELAIRVHVRARRPAAELPPEQVIPPRIDGIATDVVEDEPMQPF